MNLDDPEVMNRIHEDLIDSYDEEFELELEDSHLERAAGVAEQTKESRRAYFRELFRLQAELVKLQDWVADTGHSGDYF